MTFIPSLSDSQVARLENEARDWGFVDASCMIVQNDNAFIVVNAYYGAFVCTGMDSLGSGAEYLIFKHANSLLKEGEEYRFFLNGI